MPPKSLATPEEITRGRRLTALYGGFCGAVGAAGIRLLETDARPAGIVMTIASVLGEVGLTYAYYDGDGDLSPHRSRARHPVAPLAHSDSHPETSPL